MISQIVAGLKHRSDKVRLKTAQQLRQYVTTELREMSAEDANAFTEELNKNVFVLISSSSEVHEKKGGVLAILALIGLDDVGSNNKFNRFTTYMRSLLPSNDPVVMELAAKVAGRLVSSGGSLAAESVEHEVHRALEWLSGERVEVKRHAAVLLLRELAVNAPTFFFQKVQPFLDHIFNAVRDSKQIIRENAIAALRACLALMAQRETKETQRPTWYSHCYEEAMKGLKDASGSKAAIKDEVAHGSLLVLMELILNSGKLQGEGKELAAEMSDTLTPLSCLDFNVDEALPPPVSASLANATRYNQQMQWRNSGSSLMASELAHGQSKVCRDFMKENFDEVCYIVMKFRSSKSVLVQQTIHQLLPRLAAFDRTRFVKRFLDDAIMHLLAALKKERERACAFRSLGLMAYAVQDHIRPYLDNIVNVIRQALPASKDVMNAQKRHKAAQVVADPAVFSCISMLARAASSVLFNEMKQLLENMLAVGLSPALTRCLHVMAQEIPRIRKDIQEGLLKMLSLILMNKALKSSASSAKNTSSNSSSLSGDSPDTSNVVLALHTLGSFDFSGHSLTQFVRHCANVFLVSEYVSVRIEAVRTCARLLMPTLTSGSSSNALHAISGQYGVPVVSEVLAKLLTVGITDSESEIRLCVFSNLDERFDHFLAQHENLDALFVALNDEEFEIRELAVCTIGRLSNLNPAFIMPSLRKLLIQLLTDLEFSGNGRNKEQAARLLSNLISNTPRLIKPYMKSILDALIPKLKEADPNPAVTINILAAIGEQAQVSGVTMKPYVDDLLPIIISMLQDSISSGKREVALWTLGQVVGSTGCISEPYCRYPHLLEVLLNILKTETVQTIRRESMRVLGLLGALDPYKYKILISGVGHSRSRDVQQKDQAYENASEMLITIASGQLDDFFPIVAFSALMKILQDSTLKEHHILCIHALAANIRTFGALCIPFLGHIIPPYLSVIHSCEESRELLFQQLSVLATIVKGNIQPYLKDIFTVIKEFWQVTPDSSRLQESIIKLITDIASSVGSEFKVYVPWLMPQILKICSHDKSANRAITDKLLFALTKLGPTLDDYLYLIVPSIVKLFESSEMSMEIRKKALETLNALFLVVDLSEFASCIIHPIVRILDVAALRSLAMATLCSMVLVLGQKYTYFIPLISRVMQKNKIQHQDYDSLVMRVVRREPLTDDTSVTCYRRTKVSMKPETTEDASDSSVKKHNVHSLNLQVAWETSSRVSKEDWAEWLRRLSVEFLKESSSPFIRNCRTVADAYNPLAKDLFNASFVSCWLELAEQQQDELVHALEMALQTQSLPEITQTLLNLAEFMEHTDKGSLPLNTQLMGECAMKVRAYAKALHYKEEEFHAGPTTATLEALISINNKLGLSEAASGILDYANRHHGTDLRVQETWYEKLRDWNSALALYEMRQEEDEHNSELTLGRMRCLEAMGEWHRLYNVAREKWSIASEDMQLKMARMAASASWGLSNWTSMDEYTCIIPGDTYDGAFYRSVIAVHNNHFDVAQQCIDTARDIIDSELTAMVGESYNRAYGGMVCVQMLSELEEVVWYKLNPERSSVIKQIWWDRLQGCERNVEDWQRILRIRSLVLADEDNIDTLIKFASLCRKSGRMELSRKTLCRLLGVEPTAPEKPLLSAHPLVAFAFIKHMWESGQQADAYAQLDAFVLASQKVDSNALINASGLARRPAVSQSLLSKLYKKLGDWQSSLHGYNEDTIPHILTSYEKATQLDRDCYKAWHSWAMMNFEAVLHYKKQASGEPSSSSKLATEWIHKYTVPAVQGFFRSISLSQEKAMNSLQDTLRLLTLWFEYGHWADVHDSLEEGIKTIQIDTWLQVIPQLIARIDTPRHLVGRLIHHLLMDIGKHHPQALIYPLTVASKSTVMARRNAANLVLQNMREHSNTLVSQAIMVSEELIRVAILWHEQWHEGLEDASRLYFGEQKITPMFEVLDPLHVMVQKGAQTLKETSFHQAYGRDLQEAYEWGRRYKKYGNEKDLTQAWDLYYHIFRRIAKQLPQLTSLELQYVSPKLLSCRDLELAVPGSYDANKPIVRIQKVAPALNVITSKQRPRKLSLYGSDGAEFMFLLKGHEDLRQDERVMQLFGLVNTLLANDPETFKRHLSILRYSVIPLSTNSGLIGWVPHCDTLHALIRDYREKRKILLNVEHRLMVRMAPEYDHLTVLQKVEVFEHAISHTDGDDLAKVLWLKSPSSEVWFDRRTNFTRSLAVMSMVGYVLGLGDRHPSNLMLERLSGRILHIDFGDCFEVAMTREKYPEKIPFRLTRMLTNAMEVTGIEGNYRITCHSIMRVLRDNKDSVMAVLEAFVYDPLLNWRLTMETAGPKKEPQTSTNNIEEDGSGLQHNDSMMHVSQPSRSYKVSSVSFQNSHGLQPPEVMNKKALEITKRVRDKLTGHDFAESDYCDTRTQVNLLIKQAIANENLCQCYIGWCPFW
eukprot:scpid3818/ scgid5118/ Serine/threonine-protein kinase mTOR; FK506-binding protein 12-rapamycin complex-associated protein 1; FKBP12-rapamycin complex-associated protein; Mammalian target of rapamycin; Mechanistic target of rapamycin; Rapamycin target protein 1